MVVIPNEVRNLLLYIRAGLQSRPNILGLPEILDCPNKCVFTSQA